MDKFYIQLNSEIPASKQLLNQILLAIASRQLPPGSRLPSTRQMAMQTGLHRNTINKVYSQLEKRCVVRNVVGSGIYVRSQKYEGKPELKPLLLEQSCQAQKLVKQSLDELLKQGYSLDKARKFFLAEIDWRLHCAAHVLVTAPSHDIGAGELMMRQLKQVLQITIELVPIEELKQIVSPTSFSTILTSRYFIGELEAIGLPESVRVFEVDIYDYAQEIQLIQRLPKGSCVGLVSLSSGTLQVAEVIINSLRGDDLLVMTATLRQIDKVHNIIRCARILISDQACFPTVRAAVVMLKKDLIRPPQLICCKDFVNTKSINLLKRDLGLE